MKREQVLKNMDEAFREDRERFFKVADSLLFVPKFKDKLDAIEQLKQQWRDIPQQEDYPNFTHPVALPDWFPEVHFASSWQKDTFIEEMTSDETENNNEELDDEE